MRHTIPVRNVSIEPTLEQLRYRLEYDMKLLEKHPDKKDLLEKRIARTKDAIADNILLSGLRSL